MSVLKLYYVTVETILFFKITIILWRDYIYNFSRFESSHGPENLIDGAVMIVSTLPRKDVARLPEVKRPNFEARVNRHFDCNTVDIFTSSAK